MAQLFNAPANASMASRWRRRRMCVLHADTPSPAALEAVSGRGARLRSNARPARDAEIVLHHPVAGEIAARVSAVGEHGIDIAFAGDEASVAFALRAIAADMTQGD